jgi:phage-related protein
MAALSRKPIYFVGRSWKDLRRLPGEVQDTIGALLLDVQFGETPISAKVLKGFHGAGVLELVEDFDRNSYRAIYTIDFPRAIYVLHVFQKKSKRGIGTPRRDRELVRERYGLAKRHHESLKPEDAHG